MVFNLSNDISQVQCLIQHYRHIYCMLFLNLFRCTVFYNATAARKVGHDIAVQREWDLRMSSYFRFIRLIRVCAKCGNGHALFILGLVKSQPLSLIFPNYLPLLSMYLMLIFCLRISTDGGKSDWAATPTPSHGQETHHSGLHVWLSHDRGQHWCLA
jgi:hypothetical protein